MSGTVAGALKTAKKNKELYGEDYYSRIGRTGGLKGHTGGFYNNPELARRAGKLGGHKSTRLGVNNKPKFIDHHAFLQVLGQVVEDEPKKKRFWVI